MTMPLLTSNESVLGPFLFLATGGHTLVYVLRAHVTLYYQSGYTGSAS